MNARIAEKPRLLFVDDERRVLNSMRAMFRRDYELFLTTRGDEALRIISEQAIDVLVADQRMPLMTGVEVLSAARRSSPNTVRILLTGYSDPEAIEGALTEGKVFRLLNKPCPASELRGIISEAVKAARAPTDPALQIILKQSAPANDSAAVAAKPDPSTQVQNPWPDGGDGIGSHAGVGDPSSMEIVMSGDTITVLEHGEQWLPAGNATDSTPRGPDPQTENQQERSEQGNAAHAMPRAKTDLATDGGNAVSARIQRILTPLVSRAASDFERLRGWLSDTTRDSPTLMLYVIGALLAVLAAAATVLTLQGTDAPATVALVVEPAPLETGSALRRRAPKTLEANLEFGALALDAGALIAPPDASALAFYLDARDQAPDNDAVTRGLEDLAQRIGTVARSQLTQENYPGLLASLEALRTIDASDPQLAALHAETGQVVDARFALARSAIAAGQFDEALTMLDRLAVLPTVEPARIAATREAVEAARQRADRRAAARANAAAQAARIQQTGQVEALSSAATSATLETDIAGTATPRSPDVDELLASARASLSAGRLTGPADDSALHYLREVERVEPDNPRLASAYDDLGQAVAQRAFASASEGEWRAAEKTLDEAQALGLNPDTIERTRATIITERRALESARLVPVGQMQARSINQPRYPDMARRADQEGWVLLNFTIRTDGTVADVTTVDRSDRFGGQFERAAVFAAQRWEFEPREFLGQRIPQRVQARVNFELRD